MNNGLRNRFFGWWAGVVTRYPVPILILATLAAVASVMYAHQKWSFQSDRNLLIYQGLKWNHRFIEISDHLPGSHDMVVAVDAGPDAAKEGTPAFKAARDFVDDLGPRLRESPYVTGVLWGFEESKASPKAMRLLPMDQFQAQVEKIREAGPLINSPTPDALIAQVQREMLSSFTQQIGEFLGGLFGSGGKPPPASKPSSKDADAKIAADIRDLNRMLQAFAAFFESPPDKPLDFGALAEPPGAKQSGWRYLTSENDRILFIRVSPKVNIEQLDPLEVSLKGVRGLVAEAVKRHPGVDAGVTGQEVLDADETQAATWDSTWTSILATVLITALLVLAFQSLRTPVLTVVALLYGITWTYGFLFLAVGHLQVLSVVFNVMLLGLGIAYGIYMASAFELIRHDYPDDLDGFRQTMARTLEMMGPGVATGCFATAASFATTIFTDFTGVAEMGLIAGVGILLCLLAMFTVFPVLFRLFKYDHKHIAPMESRYVTFFRPEWATPFVRHPVATLALAAVVTAASLFAIVLELRFDFDLISLQPRNAPGVVWMQRIMREGQEQKIWSNLSVVRTLDEGRALAAKFRGLDKVADVGGIGLLFPRDEAAKMEVLSGVRAQIGPALLKALGRDPWVAPATPGQEPPAATPPASMPATAPATAASQPDLLAQINVLGVALRSAMSMKDVPPPIREALREVNATLTRIRAAVEGLTPEERAARVAHLERAFAKWRLDSLHHIAAALDPRPLDFTDLPHEIMGSYELMPEVRQALGRYILEVYPKLPKEITSPLDPLFLPGFEAQTETVDPDISGIMRQIYESGRLIRDSYENAGYVALALVFLIVLLDYAGWKHALIEMPLVVLSLAMVLSHSEYWRHKLHVAGVLKPMPYDTWVWMAVFAVVLLIFAVVRQFRRGMHDALLILLPVAMAFAVTFGVMWLVGMQVNAANIIVLPLMFGIGVDSGVHVLNRYRQDPDGEPVGLTQGTGKGITITCLTSVIGFGSMVLSSHRGIASLGFVLALGLTMTMLACWTVMPAWLALRNRYRRKYGLAVET